MPSAHLSDRRLIRVSGISALDFLENLITTHVEALPMHEARAGALLTPQGKILFDFLIWRDGVDYILETQACSLDALLRRLTMYRLHASVDLAANATDGVSVIWGNAEPSYGLKDGRFAKAGIDLFRVTDQSAQEYATAYDALRVNNGIAEAGRDYALQDAFPHDVMMDMNDGLCLSKGCFVGQEVVSRMKHRGTARRRVVTVESTNNLSPSGTDITAGGKPVGTLGTVIGRKALAIVRTDRVADALASGVPLLVADTDVTLTLPLWSGLSFLAANPAEGAEE